MNDLILNDVDYRCIYPNGECVVCRVLSIKDGMAKVIWNEEHEPINGCGCVVGMEDNVPLHWINP